MHGPDDGQTVLGLGILDRVAAGQDAAALSDGRRSTREDRRHRLARQVLRKGGDAQREEDATAHGVDVAHGVGRRDGSERGRVVHERREEVERTHDGKVIAQAIDRRIIRCVETDEQRVGGRLGVVACTSA